MHVLRLVIIAITVAYGVSATTNGMHRLPTSALQNLQPNGRVQVAEGMTSNVTLQQSEAFYMGNPTNPSNPLVQLTAMSNSSDTRLLSTERISDAIERMNCTEDRVQIQFSSKTYFDDAHGTWAWINQAPSRLVILVTGGDDCAVAPILNSNTPRSGGEQSYAITNIEFNTTGLSATLNGSPESLSQLLDGHWKLQGSSRGIIGTGLQQRDSTGSIGLSKSVNIPDVFNHKVAGPVNASLSAVLSSQGSIHWDFDVDALDLGSSTLKLTTTGVSFTLKPQLSLSGSVDAIPPVSISLPNIPLGTGIDGPLDSDIGFFLEIGAQASLGQVSAAIDASIAIELALSDGSVTLSGSSNPSVTGFSPTFSVHSPEVSGQADVKSNAGPTVALVMQASLLDFGFKGGLQLEAPEADMTLAAKADTAGVCSIDHSIGLEIDVSVGAALKAILAIGDLSDASTSSLKIYSTAKPVFSTCTAFGPTITTPSPKATASSSVPAIFNPLTGLPLTPLVSFGTATRTTSTKSTSINTTLNSNNPLNGLLVAPPLSLTRTS